MSFPNSPKSFALIGVILAALGGGAWGVAHYSNSAPADTGPAIPDEYSVAKIKAAMKDDPKTRGDKMREFMERKDLTDEQREKIGDNLRQAFEEEMDNRVNEYFAAKPEDRDAILDKQIDEMEQRRKDFEARREQEEKDAKKADDEKERDKRREEWRKREASKSQTQRKSDFESRDPDKRAQRASYFRAVQARMAARGIQGGRFGPWGGGRGPGGGGGGGGRRGGGG